MATALEATDTLDGKPIIRMQDKVGTVYYVGMNKIRVATKGREADIKPITSAALPEAEPVQEQEDVDPHQYDMPDIPGIKAFPFMAVCVATAAILAGHGYHEQHGYVANRCGERAAVLSMPDGEGGSIRYRLQFPEEMLVPYEVAD